MAKAGDFVSRWKAAFGPRRKIVGRSHCWSAPFAARSPSKKAVGAVLSGVEGKLAAGFFTTMLPRHSSPLLLCHELHETGDVLRRDLHPDRGPKRVDSQQPKVLIEVA